MPADALSQAQPHLRRPPSCHHSVVTTLWRQHPFFLHQHLPAFLAVIGLVHFWLPYFSQYVRCFSLTHSLLQFREGRILFGYAPFFFFRHSFLSTAHLFSLGFHPLVRVVTFHFSFHSSYQHSFGSGRDLDILLREGRFSWVHSCSVICNSAPPHYFVSHDITIILTLQHLQLSTYVESFTSLLEGGCQNLGFVRAAKLRPCGDIKVM
ncbi:hypothetical protein C8J56DRAFT_69325 [Mycena floridula]|nr:hypothetical protein C8J56DRAFT_69325 [Mycena floridula]